MLRGIAVLLAWLLACAPAQAELRLDDLTDEFDTFWQRSQTMAPDARIAAFYAEMGRLLPGFFSAERIGVDQARYDQHVLRGLAAYPEQREGIREVSRRFDALFAPARASFERTFGPVATSRPIYLINSLGEMDGGTRDLPDGNALIFGADMIARYHLGHDIQPFFHHELFHVYHLPRFSRCEALWCGLWTEGLATYVAKSLNPDASDAELLLEIPEPIRPAVEANRAEAVCAVVARLDSTDDEARRALFSFGRMNERLPPRFGYFVGYLAAERLGRTRDLRQLAAMTPEEVRPALDEALRGLATCPA